MQLLARTHALSHRPGVRALGPPGDPGRSPIAVRMRALNSNRTPPLSTSVVDSEGAALTDSWIASFSTCP